MMFHEPFLGTLPFGIDLHYFARWLAGDKGSQDETDHQMPGTPVEAAGFSDSTHCTHAKLLVESAVSEFHKF